MDTPRPAILSAMSRRDFTPWAKKYGAKQTYRSSLTPIDSELPTTDLSEEALEEIQQGIKVQQKTLYGFTTRELIDRDAISSRELKPCNLGNDEKRDPMLCKDK